MRVEITIHHKDPQRASVRSDAELWLTHRARSKWQVREDEDWDGDEVLSFEFMDPLDAMDFYYRTVPNEHRGRLI